MIVTRRSPLSGRVHTMDIPKLTEAQLNAYLHGASPIQAALPHLNPDEREFIMTGITPEEWDNTFKESAE